MKIVPPSGGAICDPPPDKWTKSANDNKEALKDFRLSPLSKKWRQEVLKLAQSYTSELGFPAEEVNPKKPLLLSGHQPYFYHPGVLYKYRMLSLADENLFTRIFITVDTDSSMGFPVKLPAFNGQYTFAGIVAVPSSANDFYCDAKTDGDAIKTFLEQAETALATLPEKPFEGRLDFLRLELSQKLPAKMCDAMVLLRKKYSAGWSEPDTGVVLEAPLSAICETTQFFEFAYDMLTRPVEIHKGFNEILAGYRKEHGIRSKANPFPDLAQTGAFTETLLWLVKGNEREPLFVKSSGAKVTLLIDGETEIADANTLRELFCSGDIKLWPRAVTLSIMLRMFLSDLFIHGIGGAKYDAVTDSLIRRIYSAEPPGFVTASCTLKMPGMEDPSSLLADMNQTIRQMQFHPESYLKHSAEVERITNEKNRLVEEIRKPDAGKKAIGKKISELNDALNKELTPIKDELEGKMESIKGELNRYNFLTDREFPYFLFPPELMPGKP